MLTDDLVAGPAVPHVVLQAVGLALKTADALARARVGHGRLEAAVFADQTRIERCRFRHGPFCLTIWSTPGKLLCVQKIGIRLLPGAGTPCTLVDMACADEPAVNG